jgi:hypothetical protein
MRHSVNHQLFERNRRASLTKRGACPFEHRILNFEAEKQRTKWSESLFLRSSNPTRKSEAPSVVSCISFGKIFRSFFVGEKKKKKKIRIIKSKKVLQSFSRVLSRGPIITRGNLERERGVKKRLKNFFNTFLL